MKPGTQAILRVAKHRRNKAPDLRKYLGNSLRELEFHWQRPFIYWGPLFSTIEHKRQWLPPANGQFPNQN